MLVEVATVTIVIYNSLIIIVMKCDKNAIVWSDSCGA